MSRGHPVPFPALLVQASVSDPHNPDMAQRGRSFLCPSFFQEEFRIQVMNQERVQITTIEERLTSESWTVTFQTRPGGPVGGGGVFPECPAPGVVLAARGRSVRAGSQGPYPQRRRPHPRRACALHDSDSQPWEGEGPISTEIKRIGTLRL